MILSDFECSWCGNVHEELIEWDDTQAVCPKCHAASDRIITLGGVYTGNQDGSYARDSAAALLDMDTAHKSPDPLARALAANPNRENLKAYMKAHNLRHAENEKGAPPVYRKPPDRDLRDVADLLYRRHRERQRIEIS